MNRPVTILKEFLRLTLKEYWGEPAGTVNRNGSTMKAASDSPIKDPFHLDDDEGVYVPKDVRKDIKKYFKDMKLEPSDEPGKTYK